MQHIPGEGTGESRNNRTRCLGKSRSPCREANSGSKGTEEGMTRSLLGPAGKTVGTGQMLSPGPRPKPHCCGALAAGSLQQRRGQALASRQEGQWGGSRPSSPSKQGSLSPRTPPAPPSPSRPGCPLS